MQCTKVKRGIIFNEKNESKSACQNVPAKRRRGRSVGIKQESGMLNAEEAYEDKTRSSQISLSESESKLKHTSSYMKPVNEVLRKRCLHNEIIKTGKKVEIPVETAEGITQRYRNILDQTELRVMFDGADSDNSKFLEAEEVMRLLTGGLINHFTCGDKKVIATVRACIEERVVGKDSDNFQ